MGPGTVGPGGMTGPGGMMGPGMMGPGWNAEMARDKTGIDGRAWGSWE